MTTIGTEEKVNKPLSPADPAEGNKKHIPVIEAPEAVTAGEPFEVTVTVDSISHVMEEKHFIEWVELYLHNKLIGREELSPSDTKVAKVTFKVEADKALIAIKEIETCRIRGVNICGDCGEKSVIANLRAVEKCNVHGILETNRKIEVMSGEEKEEGKKCVWKA